MSLIDKSDTIEDVAKIYQGPVLLIAGAGTGKTYELARRVKYLVEEKGVNPDEISVIAFTGEAARNMRQRISDPEKKEVWVSPERQPSRICTMHSLGYQIIAGNLEKLGLSENFRVVSEDSLKSLLIEDAARIVDLGHSISITTAKCRQYGLCNPSEESKCIICQKYRELLMANNAIDYDDQIILACKILKEDSELLKRYRFYCKIFLQSA